MADVPSVFTRADFFAVLLPGYLMIIDYLLLFQPKLLFTSANSTLTLASGTNSVSVNLLSTAIFLVAGPVAGLVIRQTHRGLLRTIWSFRKGQRKRLPDDDKRYFKRLLEAKDTAIGQLDRKESQYDFDVSSALVLFLLNFLHIGLYGLSSPYLISGLFIAAVLLVVDAVFAFQGYLRLLEAFIHSDESGPHPPIPPAIL